MSCGFEDFPNHMAVTASSLYLVNDMISATLALLTN